MKLSKIFTSWQALMHEVCSRLKRRLQGLHAPSDVDILEVKQVAKTTENAGKTCELVVKADDVVAKASDDGSAIDKMMDIVLEYDQDTIKSMFFPMSELNIKSDHAYDGQLLRMLDAIKKKGQMNVNELVLQKTVENEIGNVASGGVGVIKNNNGGLTPFAKNVAAG